MTIIYLRKIFFWYAVKISLCNSLHCCVNENVLKFYTLKTLIHKTKSSRSNCLMFDSYLTFKLSDISFSWLLVTNKKNTVLSLWTFRSCSPLVSSLTAGLKTCNVISWDIMNKTKLFSVLKINLNLSLNIMGYLWFILHR